MSKKLNKNVPVLRFPEFKSDWKLGEASDFISRLDAGVSVNSEDRPANKFEKGILKTSCISNGVFAPHENKAVTDKYELSRLNESVTKQTVLISRMNTPTLVGANSYIDKDYPNLFLPDRLWAAKIKKSYSPKWIAYCFFRRKTRMLLSSRATGTSNSMKNITKDDVLTLPVYCPLLEEQEKIVSFLGAVDLRITQLRRKRELLQSYKRGVMQKIFSQEIRFKSAINSPFPNWETKKIGQFAPLQRGFDLPVDNIVEGQFPVVFSNGILKRHYEYKVTSPGVVTGRSGTIGKVMYIEENFWPHNTSLWVTNFRGNLPRFVYYFYIWLDLTRFSSGSGVPTLNRNDVHTYSIDFPLIQEQEKIANFLTAIDRKIEALSRQIEQTEKFKKGLFQKLFV